VPFSNSFSNCSKNEDIDTFGNKIIILKKVKSLRQLRRSEKERVRLCYKEAIIKGFTLKGIQQYIASKTKIWIEWSCLETLKKTEEQENREWYLRLAKDHWAYIDVFHKAIDEIEEYKKQNWLIVMDSKADHSVRIQALKELHSLSKTYTLIVKDLPFVTLLTKYYDRNLLFINDNGSPIDTNEKTFWSKGNRRLDKDLVSDTNGRYNKLKDKDSTKVEFNDSNNGKALTTIMDGSTIDNSEENADQYKDIDEEMMEEIANQTHRMDFLKGKKYEEITQEDWDRIETPEFKESIRKVKELLDE
jgi:hypothetical protein